MTSSVSVDSISADGTGFTIKIAKTGSDTANIAILTNQNGASHTDAYDVFDVKTSTTTLACTATVFFFHPTVTCKVDDTQAPGAATVTVTVANAPAHNGATNYKISAADGGKITEFIAAAGFPPLRAGS
jgi:hypothetical protein